MASCDVFLPTCTLNVRRNSEPTRAPAEALMSSKLQDFLEAIKPGWFDLFASAFAVAGVEFEDIPSLCAKQRGRLEDELRKAGAKLLHIKKIRNALDSLVACSTPCKVSSDQSSADPTLLYQSPLASYFGDYNCFNALAALTSASPVADLKTKFNLLGAMCNQNVDIAHADSANNAFDDTPSSVKNNADNKCSLLSSDGLPLKSPMSAYFDGHDCFGLSGSFHSSNLLSPVRAASSKSSSQQTDSFLGATTNVLSPLPEERVYSEAKSIRWADEVDEIRTLQLAELIGTSFQQVGEVSVEQSVWELAKDPKGCREVQKDLSECDSDDERVAIAEHLRGHVMDAVRCPHANHVLRKVIEVLPPLYSNFIIEEIIQEGLAGVKEVAMHRYGCRIMEELLRVCDSLQLVEIVEYLLVEAEVLCTHMYGNFVMKGVLRHASASQQQRLVIALTHNLVSICTSFYGCAVLTEVFQTARNAGQDLAHMILSVSGLLSAVAKHKHGRSVLEAMMTLLGDDQRRLVVKELTLPPLKVAKVAKNTRK